MHPRVQDGNRASDNSLVREFLRSKSIEHVILLLLAEDVEASLIVLSDKVDGASGHLLLLFIAFHCLTLLVVFKSPYTGISENGT